MITVKEYSRQKIGVFGLGMAGEATIASLLASDAEVYAWDDGEEGRTRAAAQFKRAKLQNINDWPWSEMAALVLSPGIPLTHPKPHAVVTLAHKHNVPVIGDIELLYRACKEARYVAITGTNGKSTTTTLIGHIVKTAGLNVEIGGNLGTAALSLKALGKDGIYVLELSSYQLDLLATTRFTVAAFLNVTPDHLDRHGTMEGYVAAKKHIFDRQQSSDVAVIAIDDAFTEGVADELKRHKQQRMLEVSSLSEIAGGVYVQDGFLYDETAPAARKYDLNGIVTLTGRHNWQNAAISYAAALCLGIAPDVIYKAMHSFGGLRHRLQLVATIRGVRFINDSKATNANATSNALAPYNKIYWILGGKPKAGGIETLTSYFPKIAHAFIIGEAEEEFAATLEGKVHYTRSHTLKAAVKQAADLAFIEGKKNAVVLLSPACASFDQWKNFEERGDAFCQMVEALAAQGEAA